MCLWAQCVHAMKFNDQRTTELVLSFYHVGSSDPVQVIRLCGKLLYRLKHLNGHFFFFSYPIFETRFLTVYEAPGFG